ncbi:MAG TPA: class I SAM-dependent methyltransferase [Anaerolineales bacterium]|nr:class I SAM-dependent methyltransferase [Anaerolineales bacterium]
MKSTLADIETIKSRMKATWMAGDFGLIAKSYEPGAADFVARLRLKPGTRVLDVACGTGNLSLPAARAGAAVTGVDIAANLLEQGRARAAAEGLAIQFDEGDAEQLPYPDASFDVVVSMFGAIFAPRPERVVAELIRVCRPGGRIAMANWTRGGFIGQVFRTTAAYAPPPTGVPSPLAWGDEATVREWLSAGVSELRLKRRQIAFLYAFSPAEVIEFWRTYYGPTQRAFDALAANPESQTALQRDLVQLWTQHNQSANGVTHVESEYLEVAATRSPQ